MSRRETLPHLWATHGGKRPGAGRPAQGLARHQVMLDPTTVAKARLVGSGNLSAGLRAIVQKARVK